MDKELVTEAYLLGEFFKGFWGSTLVSWVGSYQALFFVNVARFASERASSSQTMVSVT